MTYELDASCSMDCPLCHGSGWQRVKVDDGYEYVVECPNRRTPRWSRKLGISQEEAVHLDWSKFAVRKSSTQIKRALGLLLSRGYGFCYLWGTPGTGKTVMSKSATVLAYYKNGLDAHYCTQSELTNALRASYDEDAGQSAYKRKLDWYCKVRWLVIDEIGRDRRNDFSKAVLSDILNARYNASIERKTSVTVLISNFEPKEVLDDYQLDRVNDKRSSVLHITDVSFRALPLFNEQREVDPLWWQKL